MVDDINFSFTDDAGGILCGKYKGQNLYSSFENKIIFSKVFDENKDVQIIYYSYNNVVDLSNVEKDVLEYESDESLIPAPFQEPILVFGTCMRLKGNPQHIRFNYWLSMYKEALANMVSKCSLDMGFAPVVRLHRR